MATKPNKPNNEDAGTPGSDVATAAAPVAGVAEVPASVVTETNTTVATAERAGAESAAPVELPVEFDESVIRAWLESPMGKSFLLAQRLAAAPTPPAPEPVDPATLTPRERAAFDVGIYPTDLLDYREYDDRVVVVTVAGRKLVAARG